MARKRRHGPHARGHHRKSSKRKLSVRSAEMPTLKQVRYHDFFDRKREMQRKRIDRLRRIYPPIRGRVENVYGRRITPRPVHTTKRFGTIPIGLGFRRAAHARFCYRRAQRRQLLFSIGKVGSGVKGPRKKVYNALSKIICKR